MRTMHRIASTAAALSLALTGALACEPMGPLPGGELSGPVAESLASDWSFTDALDTVEVETDPSDPYSVTTWCVANEGQLYVPTRDPDSRKWVTKIRANPQVRVRAGGTLYPGRLLEVTDPDEFERVGSTLIAKYEMDRPGDDEKVAIFRLDPR